MNTIQTKLNAVKRLTKLHEAATVAIALATFAIVFFATEIALDRLFLLDRRFRAGALVSFAAIGVVALLCGAVYLFRKLSDIFAARVIEAHAPELRQSLITYVQMQTGDALGSDYALELIEKRLSKDLVPINVAPVVRRRVAALAITAAVIALTFVGTSAAVAGRGFFVCLERAVRPNVLVAPPTHTRIVEVAPGDAHALAASDVGVVAVMEGAEPSSASVYITYEEGAWFSAPMKRVGDRWAATLPGSQVSFRYFIAAGDTRSDVFSVTVLPPPMLSNVTAVVDLPAYTGLGQKTVQGGDLEVLPQSFITLRGYPNRAMKTAAVVFDGGARIPLRGRGLDRAIAEFSATMSGGYRIELEDEFGLRNPSPQRFRLELRDDRAPEIVIVSPGPVAEQLPDQRINLQVEANDDYGIVMMQLHFVRRGEAEQKLALPYAPQLGSRQSFEFRPQEFGLVAPDAMMYWIEATDRAPTPNVGRSGIHVLQLRRRPTDDLAEYEPLKKSLRDLAASEAMRKKLGLEEQTEKTDDQKAKDAQVMDKLRELLKKQSDLVKEIEKLGPGKDDDLKRVRDELKELLETAKKSEAETRDLPSRGVSKQEALADAAAEKLRQLQRRAEALRKQLERLSQDKSDPKRAEALKAIAKKLGDAGRRLEDAARDLAAKDMAGSLEAQKQAQNDLDSARQAMDDLLGADLSAEDKAKAEELAKLEKLLRERTEELRKTASPDDAERLKKAEKSMRDAQRALEQGNPEAADDAAQAAEDELEKSEKANEPPNESAEIPEELAKSLSAALQELLKEHEAVRASTKDVDGRRSGGVLKKDDAAALHELAKREGSLGEKAKEILRDLERENAAVFRWMIEEIRSNLLETRDLMEAEDRTDGYVLHLQEVVTERLKQLIEALKPLPKPSGGGGGGSGKPVKVGFEAQLKLLRAVQADILARTQAMRSKADGDLTASDRAVLNRLYQQQEDLRKLVNDLADALQKEK